jgi:putative intracellular protease/amidase
MWIPHVVTDGRLVTSRWPRDAAAFAHHFAEAIASSLTTRETAARSTSS